MLFRFERWLLGILAVSVLVMIALILIAGLRSRDRADASLEIARKLELSHTALFPAGTPRRHPEGMHRGVPLDYTPFLTIRHDGRTK